jgi:hypothetical protein
MCHLAAPLGPHRGHIRVRAVGISGVATEDRTEGVVPTRPLVIGRKYPSDADEETF